MTGLPLRFAVVNAWRETRGAPAHVVIFVVCVALGVAALACVGTLASGFQRGLEREGRALVGGDVEVRASRPFPPALAAEIGRLDEGGADVAAVRELVGMARDPRTGRTLLVELKTLAPTYPLYGVLETAPGRAATRVTEEGGALVGEELLTRLGLGLGDRIALGDVEVTIHGVVHREPDRPATLVRLGPRVFLTPEVLDRSGLLGRGSRVRYRTLVRLPASVPPSMARERLLATVTDPGIRIVTFAEAQPGLRRTFSQVTAYLGLVGAASLFVGGIGVASSVTTFLRRRVLALAILKVTGATSRVLVTTYLLQTVALALVGSAVGVVLGVGVQPMVTSVLRGLLPVELGLGLDVHTVARAAGMGVGTTLLCAIWPLLRIRGVRPSLLLRSEIDPALPEARRPWLTAAPIAAGLVGLAVWQAGSLGIGLIFVGASAIALVVLVALARAVAVAARASSHVSGPAWRQGLASLRRPGPQRVAVVVALGVAAMLLTTVTLLERSLGREIDHERRREAPSFFFIDIQEDQAAAFARVVEERVGRAPALTPVVRVRLAAVDGVGVTRDMAARRAGSPDRTWYFTREYVVTSAETPPEHNALVRGRWWTAAEATAAPRVSIEEEAARALGVDVGSRLTLDIQGVPLEAQVMSVRRVDWQSLATNFFVILSPGALDGAPATYVATARVAPGDEVGVQDAVVRTFPNVTAIPVRDVLERLAGVLDRLASAVRTLGSFTLGSGLIVMAVALAGTRSERVYESVILRTIGASRATVARAFAVEYACLGAVAGVGGSVLAAILAWVLLRWVLHLRWMLDPAVLAATVAATIVLAIAVGFAGSFRLLGQKPLAVLRRE